MIYNSAQDLTTSLQERLDLEFLEENSTPLDFMARGKEIPQDVLGFTLFLQTQQQQLLDMHVPENLWRKLYHKLKNEIFDSGSAFQFAFDEDDNRIKLVVSDEVPDGVLAANSDIFLIDHFWTSTVENSMNQLRTVPHLLERLSDIFEIKGTSIIFIFLKTNITVTVARLRSFSHRRRAGARGRRP